MDGFIRLSVQRMGEIVAFIKIHFFLKGKFNLVTLCLHPEKNNNIVLICLFLKWRQLFLTVNYSDNVILYKHKHAVASDTGVAGQQQYTYNGVKLFFNGCRLIYSPHHNCHAPLGS